VTLCDNLAMTDKLASTAEAAKAVGVSARSLTRWAHEGTVRPAVRTPGGHLRWNVEDLRRQLAGVVTAEPSK